VNLGNLNTGEANIMRWDGRVGLGVLGALLVYLLDLYNVGFARIVDSLANFEYLPYAAAVVRALPFLLMGAMWALAQRDETKWLKLVQFGLLLPALFLAWLNGAELGVARYRLYQVSDPRSMTTTLTSPYAQPAWQGIVRTFPVPWPESPEIKFLRAITGIERQRTWYVVAAGYRSVEHALERAKEINRDFKEFRAVVYRPYGENPFFKVVIGTDLAFDEAVRLRDKAVAAGIETEPSVIQHRK
jgi:hypothetical protein